MEIKEALCLQIGDLVSVKDIECAPVSFIDQYGDIGLGMDDESHEGPYQPEDIQPIALTDEILVANGFVRHYDYGYAHKHFCIERCFYGQEGFGKVITNGGEFRLSQPLMYVHELQHIMRLVGDIDLADNFGLPNK